MPSTQKLFNKCSTKLKTQNANHQMPKKMLLPKEFYYTKLLFSLEQWCLPVIPPSAPMDAIIFWMPLYSLWPSPTFCLVPLQCLSSLHTWELPVSRAQWPTFSDMLSVTHKTHSLSHCPQHPLAICNSIFKAPVAFCPRPYQHVIIACLNVSLLDSIRSPLQTNYFPCSFLDPHA